MTLGVRTGLGTGQGTGDEPRICEPGGKGLWFPLGGDTEQEWPDGVRCWIYGVALIYCFLGVSIIADAFLSAIEMITSRKRRVLNLATGRYMTIFFWNDTVANLTLLALGSSAPEILLSVVELVKNKCFSGQLGPATIVGSAAFNLLVIIAVCIIAIPSTEVRLIKETPVFYITAFFSIVAYVWLLVIVKFHSPEIVDIWEAVVTLAMFPLVVLISFLADRDCFRRKRLEPDIEIRSLEWMQTAIDATQHAGATQGWNDKPSMGLLAVSSLQAVPSGQVDGHTFHAAAAAAGLPAQAAASHANGEMPQKCLGETSTFSEELAGPRKSDAASVSADGENSGNPPRSLSMPKRGWNSEVLPVVTKKLSTSHDAAAVKWSGTKSIGAACSQSTASEAHIPGSPSIRGSRKTSVLSARSILSKGSIWSWKSASSAAFSHYSEVAQADCSYPADPSKGALHPKRWIASHRAGNLYGGKRHMPRFEDDDRHHHHPSLTLVVPGGSKPGSRRESAASVRHSFRHSQITSQSRASARSSCGPPQMSKSHPPLSFKAMESNSLQPLGSAPVKLGNRLSCEPIVAAANLADHHSMLAVGHVHSAIPSANASREGSLHDDMHPVLPAASSSHVAPPLMNPDSESAAAAHHHAKTSVKNADEPHNHHHQHEPHKHHHHHEQHEHHYTSESEHRGDRDQFDQFSQHPLPAGDNGVLICDEHLKPVICTRGVITFCSDTLDVNVGADEREVIIPVLRRNGSTGTISCLYRTECFTAIPGYDYREAEGVLEFPPGVTRGEIRLSVLPKRPSERNDRLQLILEDIEGGAVFNPNDDGGWDRCVLTVNLINDIRSQHHGLRAAALRLGERMVDPDSMRLGMAMWREQVSEAVYCNGSLEDQATASAADWMLHIMVFPWKILYAVFVPPPIYLGGWICFVLALCHIALLTAVVCDLAELFGCVAGVEDSVTAITFVALGTSLPDLFASRAAARADEYADASIVNVTGSNCVNVFLGIGLPWTVAAIYWRVKGATDKWKSNYPDHVALHPRGAFVIKNDGLAFNVIVFGFTAIICLCLIRMRRLAFGGELGGPFGPKVASGALLITLWALYLFLSIWRSKRKDASSSEIAAVVLLCIAIILCLAIVFGILLVVLPQNCSWMATKDVNSVIVRTPEPDTGVAGPARVSGAAGATPALLAAPPMPNGVPPVLNGAPLSVPPLMPHQPYPPLDDEDIWGLEDALSGPPDTNRLLKALHGCKVHQAWLHQEAGRTLDAITAIERMIRGDTGKSISAAENPAVCWDRQLSGETVESVGVNEALFQNCDSVGQVATIGHCDVVSDEAKSRHLKEKELNNRLSGSWLGTGPTIASSARSTSQPSARSTTQQSVPNDLIGMVQQDVQSTVPGTLPCQGAVQEKEMRRPLAGRLVAADSTVSTISLGVKADGSPQPMPIGSPEHAVRLQGHGKQGWSSDNV